MHLPTAFISKLFYLLDENMKKETMKREKNDIYITRPFSHKKKNENKIK